jgi:sterol desaturase/sphingolipid hydroxylase (fatty acid hydroxylase superfamily)
MRLDASGYYALAAPATLVVGLIDHLACRRRGQPGWSIARTISHLSTSMGEVLVGLFAAPIFLALYDWALQHCALLRWPSSMGWCTWVLAFLLGDLCYYLNHRAGHRVGLLWCVHNVHHQSDEFHLGIALRHPWFADVFAWPFYAPLPLLGVPTDQFFLAISIISFYALFIHSHTFGWHGLWFFVTPHTHQVHHCKNHPYVGRNMGAWLTVWDRMFGTHVEPNDHRTPLVFGTAKGYRTHNGVRAQWLGFKDLLTVAFRARRWRDKLRVIFGPPGFLPADVTVEPEPVAPTDQELSLSTKCYAVLQFAIASVVALWLLWLRSQHSVQTQLVVTLWLIASIFSIGALLDRSPHARIWESVRLLGSLGLVVAWRAHATGQ